MAARYPDLSRGESAVQTKHQHMDTQEYKAMTAEIRKMTRLADKINHLLDGANLLNAKGRLEEIVPLIRKLLPRLGKMKTQLEQYAQAFITITDENKALKRKTSSSIRTSGANGRRHSTAGLNWAGFRSKPDVWNRSSLASRRRSSRSTARVRPDRRKADTVSHSCNPF